MIEENFDIEEQDLFEHHRIVVDKGQGMVRIDKFLMDRLVNATRSRLQNGIAAESILVNDKPTKNNYRVKPLDVITIVYATPPRDTEIYPENIPLNIIYEDEAVLIVNKAAGMVVHPGFGNYTGTLVNALVYHLQNLPSMLAEIPRPGLVHRIDKDTSGLLLIAKTEFAMSFLAKQFFDHTIHRRYHTLVWGNTPDVGRIEGFIGRSFKDRKIMSLFNDENRGKHSVTHYTKIEDLGLVSMLECRLETGRTHQIRCHLQSINHSIVADESYNGYSTKINGLTGTYKKFVENTLNLCPRQALHARELGFIHPTTKEYMQFEAPIPPDMQSMIDKWRHYHQYT